MPKLNPEMLKRKQAFCAGLDEEFAHWRPHYVDLAKNILPRRYEWLQSGTNLTPHASSTEAATNVTVQSPSARQAMNAAIYDSTGTESARTLAHGLMNGLTSPSRPWFNLRLAGFPDDIEGYPQPYLTWLSDTRDRMLTVMAESNFYGSMATQYLDLVIFGIGSMIIYDDPQEVIRCYHSPVGQFRFFQDDRHMVQGMARAMNMQVQQLVSRFGMENLSPEVQNLAKQKGSNLLRTRGVYHLIEPNVSDAFEIPAQFKYREIYWEAGAKDGQVLEINGFQDRPFMASRWEVSGNDVYAHSPGMDALPDIRQLQHETLRKGQALDKMVRPPLAADSSLKTDPTSLLPGGISWLPASSQVGVKPLYTVNPPMGELSNDISLLQQRIRRIFYNHLFRNVSDLETVRSATEIMERKSEDMVILGAVLDRVSNEGLDPGIRRVFNIMSRRDMFLEPPAGLENEKIEIQYVSMLADAQRSTGTAAIERAYQTVGELSALVPSIAAVPDWDESIRRYFQMLGVEPQHVKPRDQVAAERQAEEELLAEQQAALVGEQLTKAAKNLSETEVGVGNTALDQML